MKCELMHVSERSMLFCVTEEYNPRFNEDTGRWTCNCDGYTIDGWLHPCVHIERAMRMREAICRRRQKS